MKILKYKNKDQELETLYEVYKKEKVSLPDNEIWVVFLSKPNEISQEQYEQTIIQALKQNLEVYFDDNEIIEIEFKESQASRIIFKNKLSDINCEVYNGVIQGAFSGCPIEEIVYIPDCVQYLGDCLLSGNSLLKFIKLPKYLKNTGNYFLNNCSGLQSIDLSAFSQITSIGNDFLYNCSELQSIDLTPLSQVTSIGRSFLYRCSGLQSIDLSPLSQVTSINGVIFQNCNNLKYLEIHDTINNNVLSHIYVKDQIESVSLHDLSQIFEIKDNFLSQYSKLEGLDLSPLFNITSIGNDFLSQCKNLQSLDLSSLSKLENIGNNFLTGLTNIKEINFGDLRVKSIGDSFVSGCSELNSIDLSLLSNVKSINNNFLNSCTSLESIDLSPLSNVTSIGDYFIGACGPSELDLTPLSKVTTIGKYFLCKGWSSVHNITTLNLSGLYNVTSIGDGFLSNSSNLKTFIIDRPEGLITLPLEKSEVTPDSIYVNDELIEQYKEAVPKFVDKFKPLSEYQES